MKLRVNFRPNHTLSSVQVYVDRELHKRGTDFRLYRNDWYERMRSTSGSQTPLFEGSDSRLMQDIVTGLFGSSTSGVSQIKVESFCLEIYKSRAVSLEMIQEMVLEIARDVGYEPEVVDDC